MEDFAEEEIDEESLSDQEKNVREKLERLYKLLDNGDYEDFETYVEEQGFNREKVIKSYFENRVKRKAASEVLQAANGLKETYKSVRQADEKLGSAERTGSGQMMAQADEIIGEARKSVKIVEKLGNDAFSWAKMAELAAERYGMDQHARHADRFKVRIEDAEEKAEILDTELDKIERELEELAS